jgi:hypothetical protein
MAAVIQAAHALGRPGHDMRYAGCHFLLAARAPEGPRRPGTADPADEPLAVAVGLPTGDPADGSAEVELGALTASAMGSRHGPSLGGDEQGEGMRVLTPHSLRPVLTNDGQG